MRFPFVLRGTYEMLKAEHAALAEQVTESVSDNRALRDHLSTIITEGAEHTKELYARIEELERQLMIAHILFN